mmetsp:Transcript_6620/g.8021  ORF Transcript_6620/g.8021 Transcript_6620/m.8021 type:complete len:377 (+) Transcript_6620:110-1240(+)
MDDSSLLGVGDSGVFLGAKREEFEGCFVPSKAEKTSSQFATFEDRIRTFKNDQYKQLLKKQSQNIIKRCLKCNKACASSPLAPSCNSCGATLPSEESTSSNVFTGFAFGIGKGPFPYTISLRFQSPSILVFDDLLALSSCHLNAIPTTHHIVDWRFLLKRPKEGLEILNNLQLAAERVFTESFWTNQKWKERFFHPKFHKVAAKAVLDLAFAGMNFPPSQFQLHLQFIVPPLLPYQYHLYQKGVHATKFRFFPLKYIRKILETGEKMDITMKTNVFDIITYFEKLGISYDDIYKEAYDSLDKNHKLLANYLAKDFMYRLRGDTVFHAVTHMPCNFEKSEVVTKDKSVLQNYGRPYSEQKPTGTYYKYAKKTPLEEW